MENENWQLKCCANYGPIGLRSFQINQCQREGMN